MAFFDDEIEEVGTITMKEVVEIWGNELVDQMLYSLSLEGLDNGDLAKSIRYEITRTGSGLNFKLFFNDYGVFQDEEVKGAGGVRKSTSIFGRGRKGQIWRQKAPQSRFAYTTKKPPLKAIEGWAQSKGLNRFAVRESIFRQGLKPTRWFSRIIDENPFDELSVSLEVQGAENIALNIKDILENGNND